MLSIIIITKNEEKSLPRLLKSIQKQKYSGKYEIIVSDAKSTDKTRKIARRHGCKVVNGGMPSRGRNNGARVAKGDLFLFLDADVILPPHFLEENINEMKGGKISCATTIYVPLSKRTIDKILYGIYNNFAQFCQYFYPLAGGFCIFCRKDVFDRMKGFDERVKMAEDHDFVKRCGKVSKFRILKTTPVLCDIRRLEKDGRFKLVRKYLKGGIYRIVKGEMCEIPFEYELHGEKNYELWRKEL